MLSCLANSLKIATLVDVNVSRDVGDTVSRTIANIAVWRGNLNVGYCPLGDLVQLDRRAGTPPASGDVLHRRPCRRRSECLRIVPGRRGRLQSARKGLLDQDLQTRHAYAGDAHIDLDDAPQDGVELGPGHIRRPKRFNGFFESDDADDADEGARHKNTSQGNLLLSWDGQEEPHHWHWHDEDEDVGEDVERGAGDHHGFDVETRAASVRDVPYLPPRSASKGDGEEAGNGVAAREDDERDGGKSRFGRYAQESDVEKEDGELDEEYQRRVHRRDHDVHPQEARSKSSERNIPHVFPQAQLGQFHAGDRERNRQQQRQDACQIIPGDLLDQVDLAVESQGDKDSGNRQARNVRRQQLAGSRDRIFVVRNDAGRRGERVHARCHAEARPRPEAGRRARREALTHRRHLAWAICGHVVDVRTPTMSGGAETPLGPTL